MTAGSLTGRSVAVIGAGLSGLAAALECADRGARVVLFERRRRLGGLTWSFERNGLAMDNGQHVFLACCHAYRGFLSRIGADGDVVAPAPLDVPVVAPGPYRPVVGRLSRRDLPVPLHLAGSLLRYPHLSVAERLLLGRALAGLARLDPDDPRLDQVAFGDWLADRGQSPAAVAAVWDLITVPTVNLPAAEASLATAAMVFRTSLLAGREAADIGWSAVPLGHLHGERAGRALERAGVQVRTGSRIERIEERPGAGPGGDAAAWTVRCDGDTSDFDAVVVAVPHEEAARLAPEPACPDRRRWAGLGSSAIVDVHLVFDRPVTGWELMAGYRSPVQWVFDRSRSSGLAADAGRSGRQYLAVSLSAADHLMGLRPEALVGSTRDELARLLPAVTHARLVDSAVTKERLATFRAAPGSRSLRPTARTGRAGLVLAGAWTDTGWPATMEGAVRSGLAAAAALGSDRPPRGSGATAPDRVTQSNSSIPHIPQEVA